jgi:hypothetical protein
LQDFATIDDAIRFGIMCSLSEINKELRAYIEAKGSYEDLSAEITPLDTDYLSDLDAKYMPVANQPILGASISGSGGVLDLGGYVIGQTTASTTPSVLVDTLGERYIPKLVTHGEGNVSVVLTKVLSTAIIDTSGSPDLGGQIVGIATESLEAMISGTP